MPPTIISADSTKIEEFLRIHEEIVIKPLNGWAVIIFTRFQLMTQKVWEK